MCWKVKYWSHKCLRWCGVRKSGFRWFLIKVNISRSRWRFLRLCFLAFERLFWVALLRSRYFFGCTYFYDQDHFLALGGNLKDLDRSLFWDRWHFSLIKHPLYFLSTFNFHDQFLSRLFTFFSGTFSLISFWSFRSHTFLSATKYLSDQDKDFFAKPFWYFYDQFLLSPTHFLLLIKKN